MKNKALAALEPLIGEWEYTMYNCITAGFWKVMVFWREDKDFYQRRTLEIKVDDSLYTIAEASDDKGRTWRKDLEMSYVKVKRG
jgi:hypothetical protein